MIALLVFTDGRGDCLAQTVESFYSTVLGSISERIIIDDSADPLYAAWLDAAFPHFRITHHDQRRGFSGAIQSGWRQVSPKASYVFHLEDDFVFNRPVLLNDLASVLDQQAYLAQIVLRRQAWNPEEKAAGGIVEQWPNEYEEAESTSGRWLEHRLFFSTNPTLYRASLIKEGWPDAPAGERAFTDRLLADPATRFAFWGKRSDAPWVTHIGMDRVGKGY